ncbi:CPXV217 protein [Cowpox virus]|uniref:CPXV217 protein n=1 Tax=Cowpox virus TaxID=10243 RepID=A0A290GQH0_COWPX|nr:CPXV217 protein [Cowpox virus]ATB55482.1 CPXV217 protein [Cowpox virus]ATB55696.1 CPXV217 protein [Cowpox virus]ATB56126.1 CPXV217 protein [Cowpox virus]
MIYILYRFGIVIIWSMPWISLKN